MPSLPKTLRRLYSTAFSLTYSSPATSRIVSPSLPAWRHLVPARSALADRRRPARGPQAGPGQILGHPLAERLGARRRELLVGRAELVPGGASVAPDPQQRPEGVLQQGPVRQRVIRSKRLEGVLEQGGGLIEVAAGLGYPGPQAENPARKSSSRSPAASAS